MANAKPDANGKRGSVRWGRWLAVTALIAMVGLGGLVFLAYHAQPLLRERVVETLSTRFKSKVELDEFDVSVLKGLEVSGKGLRIFGEEDPNNHEAGIQPIIGVGEFTFHTGVMSLLRSPMHVDTVHIKQLALNLPPREQRGELHDMAPKSGKISIVVDKFVCDDAKLIINTLKPGKLPLEFDIESLRMKSIGPGQPLHFDAKLTNPKPVGEIQSSGSFGPWQPDSPRDTPVSGMYAFDRADLGTIKGIGGILSSKGNYGGVLDRITVDGATDTPDFRLAVSGRAVPLHTDFHAIVDGTSGDTYLQPVKARILSTPLVANGSIVRVKDPHGHHIELNVVIAKGKIDDLLKLAVRTEPPVMSGAVQLQTTLDLPPGEPAVSDRLQLSGKFQISHVHFSNEKIQSKVDSLSMRSQGKPKLAQDDIPDNVYSEMTGTFRLADGSLSFSELHFRVPGTRVSMTGVYTLDGREFDFHGKARMNARLSQMVTGWKSVLLKPVDPFFAKNGAGAEIPIKVTGTNGEPHFGSDFHHKDDASDVTSPPSK
jgi:AsmA-like C-terminal region